MTQLFILPLTEAANLNTDIEHRFPHRAARAARMQSPDDRLRCLGAGALLDYVLGIDEETIRTNEYGKPFAPRLNKAFNLSHSGNFIALAVSDSAVGVDVQQIGPARSRVAQRCFTKEELRWYEQDEKRFFTVWTLKESVAKAIGKGLKLPFNSFSVLPLLSGESITVEALTLFGQALRLPGHALAVCTAKPLDEPIQPVFLTAESFKKKSK